MVISYLAFDVKKNEEDGYYGSKKRKDEEQPAAETSLETTGPTA
jgi:hypothetical protein